MEINSKVVDALQMYTNLMKELPMYGYGGMPKPGMSQPYVQPGMPPQPQVSSFLCDFWWQSINVKSKEMPIRLFSDFIPRTLIFSVL